MEYRHGMFNKDGIFTILDASQDQVNLPDDEFDLFLCNLVAVNNPELERKYGKFVKFIKRSELPDLNEIHVLLDIDTMLQYKEKNNES